MSLIVHKAADFLVGIDMAISGDRGLTCSCHFMSTPQENRKNKFPCIFSSIAAIAMTIDLSKLREKNLPIV